MCEFVWKKENACDRYISWVVQYLVQHGETCIVASILVSDQSLQCLLSIKVLRAKYDYNSILVCTLVLL